MAGPNYVLDKGFKAGGAAAIRQWRCVRMTAVDTCAEANTAGQVVLGVCQESVSANDSSRGRVADIRIMGITRAEAGAAITLGDRLVTDNQGRVVPATAATAKQNQVGIAWAAAGAAGDYIDMLLSTTVQIDT